MVPFLSIDGDEMIFPSIKNFHFITGKFSAKLGPKELLPV